MRTRTYLVVAVSMIIGLGMGLYLAGALAPDLSPLRSARADEDAPKASPVKALSDRNVYYPGSEDLAPDEMRVVACGTGMPNARPKQAAACFLLELGNGDKFVFDAGLGCAKRISYPFRHTRIAPLITRARMPGSPEEASDGEVEEGMARPGGVRAASG